MLLVHTFEKIGDQPVSAIERIHTTTCAVQKLPLADIFIMRLRNFIWRLREAQCDAFTHSIHYVYTYTLYLKFTVRFT